MTASRPTAFIYLRISQDRSKAGLGIARQLERCEALADERGYEVLEVFEDNDISAYSGKIRPSYREMFSRLSEVDYVLAWSTSRLFRNMSEMEAYIRVCEDLNVLTLTVDDGTVDLSTSNGRFNARIYAAIAARESEHKGERIRLKTEQTIRAGRHSGGVRPFGYNLIPRTEEEVLQKLGARYEVNEEEADLIRQAVEAILSGHSMHSIVRDWNNPDRPGGSVKTTMGKAWSQQTLRQMLLKPRYAGVTTFRGEEVPEADGLIPAILPRHLWLAIKNKLESNAASLPATHTNKARYLLSGIAYCECGDLMKTGSVQSRKIDPETGARERHIVYRCRSTGPGHANKRASYVDELVRATCLDYYLSTRVGPPTALSSEEEKRLRTLEIERSALRDQLASLPNEVVSGSLTSKLAGDIERKAGEKLEDIDTELAELTERSSVSIAGLKADLEHARSHYPDFLNLSLDDQREFIRRTMKVTLLKHVHGSPRTFDPHTVDIRPLVPGVGADNAEGRIGPYFEELTTSDELSERIARYEEDSRAVYRNWVAKVGHEHARQESSSVKL